MIIRDNPLCVHHLHCCLFRRRRSVDNVLNVEPIAVILALRHVEASADSVVGCPSDWSLTHLGTIQEQKGKWKRQKLSVRLQHYGNNGVPAEGARHPVVFVLSLHQSGIGHHSDAIEKFKGVALAAAVPE